MNINHNKQSSDKTGMMPGSAVYVGENPPQHSVITVHTYDGHSYNSDNNLNLTEIHEALASGKHIWIDIYGLADVARIGTLCGELSIHPLIVEDIVNTRQRPKVELFEHYLFIVFKLLSEPTARLTYNTEQFSMLVKKNLLLTFRESNQYDLTPLYQRLNTELSMIRQQGSDYLAYLIMDNVVDNYFNFVEASTHQLENMEDLLIEDAEKISLKEIYTIKRNTLTLRKTIAPLRDTMHLLLEDPSRLIDPNFRLFYRDLHDHTIRLLESVDLHHEMTANMLDIYLSTLNNSMSRTMKVLTQFASIFIPLTFIVGVYGMNFDYMPELKFRYGYPTVLGVMLVLVIAMRIYFKRKKLL